MAQPDAMPMLTAAVTYAGRGWMVFPTRAGTKHPATEHGVKEATAILARIQSWWSAMPTAGIAIAGGGPARLVVLDVDGDEGRVSLAALETRLGLLPPTARVRTPRGGEHRYFRFPVGLEIARVKNSVGKLGAKLDVRAQGGYVVAPPTPGYVWLEDIEVAELPAPWAARLLELAGRRSYASAALDSACEIVRAAGEGARNDTLNREAFSIGQLVGGGALAAHVVTEALIGAACTAGLSESEARATVASGLASGQQHPRTGPEPKPPPATIAEPEPPGVTTPWTELLLYDRRGSLAKDPTNALVILAQSPQWRGVFALDQFSHEITVRRAPPTCEGPTAPVVGESLADHHVTWVQYALRRLHGGQFAVETVHHAIHAAATGCGYHSLRDWLTGLTWDGTPRVRDWLSTYLGADASDYTRSVGQWWLISAIARAMRPGCQVDHMLVLEGRQGAGKSSAVRILGGDTYLGSLPDLRDHKAAAEVLSGRWIVEVGELDALRGAAAGRVKDFLSQTTDYYRPAYGRMAVERPRCVAYIGTTNEHAYLTDATGGRRYWPVRVTTLDRAALTRDREQLWAESLALYQEGRPWWPALDAQSMLDAEQDDRYATDEWERVVARWLAGRLGTEDLTTGLILAEALRVPPEKWDRVIQTRVGTVLGRLGYSARQKRIDGARVRVYEYRDSQE